MKFQRNVDNHGLGLKLISVFYVKLLYDHSRTTLWLKEKRETKKMSETILELQENASVLKVVSISQQHIQSTIFRYIFLKYRLLPARLHFWTQAVPELHLVIKQLLRLHIQFPMPRLWWSQWTKASWAGSVSNLHFLSFRREICVIKIGWISWTSIIPDEVFHAVIIKSERNHFNFAKLWSYAI